MLVQWGVDRQRLWVEPAEAASEGPSAGGGRWVVAVHGGAWQDERITYASAFELLRHVDRRGLGGVASLDYRLSPGVQHPAHLADVVGGLRVLEKRFGAREFLLVGHSCGAFLCGQACSELQSSATGASAADASSAGASAAQTPAAVVRGVVGVEGIYDLASLVDEYAAYRGFVERAFGAAPAAWPRVAWEAVPVAAIVHSEQDELVSARQPRELAARTRVAPQWLRAGAHDEVWEQLPAQWVQFFVWPASN